MKLQARSQLLEISFLFLELQNSGCPDGEIATEHCGSSHFNMIISSTVPPSSWMQFLLFRVNRLEAR